MTDVTDAEAGAESRQLPEGLTCGDCIHFSRCAWLIQAQSDWQECDWHPIRFAPAARYRQQYEALRAGVERVACQVQYKSMYAWDAWYERADLLERGRALGLEQAEQMVRALLDEAGGDGDGPCRQDQEPTA